MKRSTIVVSSLLSAVLLGAAIAQSESDPQQASDTATIREALRPLQIVVGRWRGNTFRENVVHEAVWAWDHRTDPRRPALVMTAEKNPFFRQARLTHETAADRYVLELKTPAGDVRRLEGDFAEAPRDEAGDDGRSLQRTYELVFEQTEPKTGELWRVVIDHQENNRFLMELSRRRGKAAFRRFDTISAQREGTNFALSDEGYGERTCVISGGLGTTPVTYQGRTYYVCCTGCEAAFKENPEKWVGEFPGKRTR